VTLKEWKQQWSAFDDFDLVEIIWSELEALPRPDSRPLAELFAAARADDSEAAAAVAVHASLTGNPLLCRWATAVVRGRSWVASFYRDKVAL
jgi:hypothetical protein